MDANNPLQYCPRCGAVLSQERHHGLCPACLLRQLSGDADGAGMAPEPDPWLEAAGTIIDRYRLREQIGEGGFGVVYLSEQDEPMRRQVALKIIKAGMETKEVIARFEIERQALALMDHPGIAQVYDGGVTPAGRPYFVMELVRGTPITRFCDQRRLDTRARLKLFIQVCKAVQHAHQKGIIHRDLKPSNILVTHHESEPIPKIIDFGVAKALGQKLTDKTLITGFLRMVGTPAYMSPEQAEFAGMDVDTRSDVYSLGVLLYELLTGVTPFDPETLRSAALDDMRRMIRETDPPKPSTRLQTLGQRLEEIASHRHTEASKLPHVLRGDLDWIVMKCLDKDRRRRYETANGLATDVQRHLNDEPVIARPPSRLYEFQKTVRRHKFGFLAASALFLVLSVGVVMSTLQAVRATRAEHAQESLRIEADSEKQKAHTEAARSAQVAQFMKDMLMGVGPSVAMGRDTELLREILGETAARLSELKDQPEVEADLLDTLGVVYRDLSEYSRAEELLQQALALRRQLHGGDHPDVARSIHNLATVYYFQSKNSEAQKNYEEALAMRRRLFGDRNVEVAASLYGLAEVLRRGGAGSRSKAEAAHREALAIRRELLGNTNADVARSLTGLGILLRNEPNRLGDAEKCLREALQIQRQLWGNEHPDIANTLQNLGYTVGRSPGRQAEAEALLRETVAMQRKLLGDHRDTAMSIQFLATTVTNQPQAIQLHREALEMRRKVLGDHTETTRSVQQLVDALCAQGEVEEALVVLRKQSETEELGSGNDPLPLRKLETDLAASLLRQGNVEQAAKLHRKILAELRQASGNESAELARELLTAGDALWRNAETAAEARQYLMEGYAILKKHDFSVKGLDTYALGFELRKRGDLSGAERFLRQAMEERQNSSGYAPHLMYPLKNLAEVLWSQGRTDEAKALYRDQWQIRKERLGPDDPIVSDWLFEYAEFLLGHGRPEEADLLVEAERSRQNIVPEGDDPRNAVWGIHLGNYLWAVGKRTEARALFRAGAQKADQDTLNGRAWFLATAPGADTADGVLAVELAERAVMATNRKNAQFIDTLAAAYASAGQFTSAVRVQLEAIALIPSNESNLKQELESRLSLFQFNIPYRDTDGLAQKVHALLSAEKFEQAEPLARECLTIRESVIPENWLTFNARSLLGGSLLGQKKFADAEPLLISGYEGMMARKDQISPAGRTRPSEALERVLRLYTDWDKPEAVAKWKQKLAESEQSAKP